MDLINYSPNHILMKVTEEDGFVWFFTAFYGWPEAQLKEKSWQLMEHLRGFVNGAWLCAGDFNAILNSAEKLGLRPPNSVEIDALKMCQTLVLQRIWDTQGILTCGLIRGLVMLIPK